MGYGADLQSHADKLVSLHLNGCVGGHIVYVAAQHLAGSRVCQIRQQHHIPDVQLLPDGVHLHKSDCKMLIHSITGFSTKYFEIPTPAVQTNYAGSVPS